jgi:hypothetical protein
MAETDKWAMREGRRVTLRASRAKLQPPAGLNEICIPFFFKMNCQVSRAIENLPRKDLEVIFRPVRAHGWRLPRQDEEDAKTVQFEGKFIY